MDNKHIAITFGPITRVISLARKTRGMWAASYLFSYLAKHIIEPFKEREFILPYMGSKLFDEKSEGVGNFPDRYIFKTEEGDYEKLIETANTVFSNLAVNLGPANKTKEEVKESLMQYFKVYFFEIERKEEQKEREFVEQCESQLALLEHREAFVPSVADDEHYLSRLFNAEKKEMRIMDFLLKDAGLSKFKSIVEITSQDEADNTNPAIPYQRYIAIVYADGDSMGQAFAQAENSSLLSEQLFNFNKKAIATINDFDGQPVFIGGDDLFFFAPIYNPGKGSILTLLQSLDRNFREALGENSPATLSFGVSITYFKYPMSEAVKLSQKLLDNAKGLYVDNEVPLEKNNILFSVQKHSGHTRGALLHKGCVETMRLYNTLADKYIVVKNDKDKKGKEEEEESNSLFLRSVMHNLREHEPILLNAITDSSLLHYYFKNNYNEPVHEGYKTFFNDLEELLTTAYKEYGSRIDKLKALMPTTDDGTKRPEGHDDAYAAIDLAYALLQFIHLVNSKRDE